MVLSLGQDTERKVSRTMAWGHPQGRPEHLLLDPYEASVIACSTIIPLPEPDLEGLELKERMVKFTTYYIDDVIGNHYKAVIQGEVLNDEDVYKAAFHILHDKDDIIYPWDVELEDIPF